MTCMPPVSWRLLITARCRPPASSSYPVSNIGITCRTATARPTSSLGFVQQASTPSSRNSSRACNDKPTVSAQEQQQGTVDAEDISSFQATRDRFGRHRRLTPSCVENQHADSISKALLAEYRIESNLAMTKIEQKLADRFKIDRSVLIREIQGAAALQPQGPVNAEIGPSGLHKYYSQDNGAGVQTFKRMSCRKGVEGDYKGNHQEVMKINHQVEIPAPMCLSVDEEYVVRISIPYAFGGRSKLIVRHIDSGNEKSMPILNLHSISIGPSYTTEDGERKYHIYFSTSNNLGRADSVYRVSYSARDGFESSCEPELLLYDDDESNHVDVSISKGKQFMIIQSTSKSSNEVHLVGPSFENDASPILVRKRQNGVMYYVDCGRLSSDVFILAHLMTDSLNVGDDMSLLGEEMTLFQTRIKDLPLDVFGDSQVLATSNGSHFIEDLDIFEDYIVLLERSRVDGTQRMQILDLLSDVDKDTRGVLVPHSLGLHDYATIVTGCNAWYESETLTFGAETPVEPAAIYSFDMKKKSLTNDVTIKQGVDMSYSRVFAVSLDGTKVPMTLFGRNDAPIDDSMSADAFHGTKRPTVLVAYGCYGEMNKMAYDPTIVPLVCRGFVVAYAHTRGGGELGRSWYRRGRGHEKERAIEDYLACAEALVGDLCIAGEGQLAAKGFSAGGVIAAAAVNKNPQLFSAMTLINPFLDVYGSMLDPSLPLTEHEYDEWGNALHDEVAAAAIRRYCPFTNITLQQYPPTFVVGTIDDLRVPYWHSSTYAMKRKEIIIQMREDVIDAQPGSVTVNNDDILLQIEEFGGHNLHSTRVLDITSLECAFLLGELSASHDGNKTASNRKRSSLLGALWGMVK